MYLLYVLPYASIRIYILIILVLIGHCTLFFGAMLMFFAYISSNLFSSNSPVLAAAPDSVLSSFSIKGAINLLNAFPITVLPIEGSSY